ncbi:response regulator transcription factor [Persicobacter psychrovividus]|uniref:DNA-binding response regulator n=1 Tax=Persicobacter psychrovividus TaxID=387638 RepID=A0ABM7VC32_9BACT|nr:DNA-binding response regulator [Persicobacter psychrovividus]
MKVLIVEDNTALSSGIVSYLKPMGYFCEVCEEVKSAIEKIQLYDYDCILLDIGLPDGSGLEVLSFIKEQGKADGVLIISAKNALDDRLEGLRLGADDYLTKPFDLAELSMRVLAITRRRRFEGNNIIRIGDLRIDLIEKQVFCGDEPVPQLTATEFQLLLFFASSKERVVSKMAIAEHLVGDHADLMDNFDFVYAHIKNLKRKLKKVGLEHLIQTIYGMGYKLSEVEA